jgi:hypothetical protein
MSTSIAAGSMPIQKPGAEGEEPAGGAGGTTIVAEALTMREPLPVAIAYASHESAGSAFEGLGPREAKAERGGARNAAAAAAAKAAAAASARSGDIVAAHRGELRIRDGSSHGRVGGEVTRCARMLCVWRTAEVHVEWLYASDSHER